MLRKVCKIGNFSRSKTSHASGMVLFFLMVNCCVFSSCQSVTVREINESEIRTKKCVLERKCSYCFLVQGRVVHRLPMLKIRLCIRGVYRELYKEVYLPQMCRELVSCGDFESILTPFRRRQQFRITSLKGVRTASKLAQETSTRHN